MIRILVTGSRAWSDKHAIATALLWAVAEVTGLRIVACTGEPWMGWARVVVVHGAAKGADTLVAEVATAWGMGVEAHPVTRQDWDTCAPGCRPGHRKQRADGSEYCPTAANRRNTRMVALHTQSPYACCLAFPASAVWSGTRDAMEKARAAGLWVVDWPLRGQALTAAAGMRYRAVGGP